MPKDFKLFLWLLKIGALVNLYFLSQTLLHNDANTDLHIVIPAVILFVVSAYRCLFPVRYKDNIVFHASALSSIFFTRLLATFSEVALIYLLAYRLRIFNSAQLPWVDLLSWWMVLQVVISQGFVWGSILSGRLRLFFYEELGWFVIYAVNAGLSAYLYLTLDTAGGQTLLLQISLVFGVFYLPWQVIHLRDLHLSARRQESEPLAREDVTKKYLLDGLRRSIFVKNQTTNAQAWGGWIGVMWMTGYWVALIPVWVHLIVQAGK